MEVGTALSLKLCFFFSFNKSVYALACIADWAAKWSARSSVQRMVARGGGIVSSIVRGPKLSIAIGFFFFFLLFLIDFIFLTMYRWCDE